MSARKLSARAVAQELLARQRAGESAAVAFDGDGTLWSGDVGEDVFRFATEHGLLREASDRALVELARAHDVAPSGTPSRTARAMFDAYLAGNFPEPTVCEMMTWCYAGFSLAELSELVHEALRQTRFTTRLHRELTHILESARAASIRAVVVSASPRPIVEIAAHAWGFAAPDIAASTAQLSDGVIQPAMDGLLPYARQKCVAARALFGDARWLAAFGDNAFDVEMFQAAELAVAVHPKAALSARLSEAELEYVLLLDHETS
jgi:phosphatidylglycerophosphatase C